MPSQKRKTHKGIKKRFKVSATGKVSHKPCGSSHLNSHKSGNKIRRLRRRRVLKSSAVSATLRRGLVLSKPGPLTPPENQTNHEAVPAAPAESTGPG